MTKPTKEQLKTLQEDAGKVAAAMAEAMYAQEVDKRACIVGAVRVAAGTAALGGMDLHRAIHMFMTFFKEADEAFKEKT